MNPPVQFKLLDRSVLTPSFSELTFIYPQNSVAAAADAPAAATTASRASRQRTRGRLADESKDVRGANVSPLFNPTNSKLRYFKHTTEGEYPSLSLFFLR